MQLFTFRLPFLRVCSCAPSLWLKQALGLLKLRWDSTWLVSPAAAVCHAAALAVCCCCCAWWSGQLRHERVERDAECGVENGQVPPAGLLQTARKVQSMGKSYLTCQERHLTAVLFGWPEDIHHLLLARNRNPGAARQTPSVTSETWKVLRSPAERNLPIEEGAFNGLSRLTTLLLQHNRLQVASEGPCWSQCRNSSTCDSMTIPGGVTASWTACQVHSSAQYRNIGNYARCAEPREFGGRQLKKLDAELLCSPQQENVLIPHPDNQPLPASQKKSDATSLCHTYVHPVLRLDCRTEVRSYCSLFWGTFGEKWEWNQVMVVKKQTHYPVWENPMIHNWLGKPWWL